MRTPDGTVIPKGIPFGQIPHGITLDLEVTNPAYRVYGLLVKLANTESRAWPGHRYLEEHLPMSRPTVAAALRCLEDTGWLVIHKERHQHTYTVVFEQAKLPLDWSRNLTGEESLPVKNVDQSGKGTSPTVVKKLAHTENQDKQPSTDNQLATPNVAWDFLTHEGGFNLPAATKAQQQRVGRLARELKASLDLASSEPYSWHDAMNEMGARASEWPSHFPDATLTAEAFVKHFELLGAPPLRRTKAQVEMARTRAALEARRQS